MKEKIIEKPEHKNIEFSEDPEIISISWEASLGKEVESFWESFDEE